MALLPGWAKRIKIKIDHNDIGSVLANFPTLVYLSSSSGYNNVDVSCIFDELQSDANRRKIAITKADGVTQCYVEIAKWDHANEKAWLFVKVPDVDPEVDTELYLYYDSTHADNTDYVGDPSDDVVHNVWDDGGSNNHKFVSHMRDDPDNEHIRDSTQYANDGAKKDAGEPAVTTEGKIDDAQNFNGTNDYIDVSYSLSLNPRNEITVSIWIYPESGAKNQSIIARDKKVPANRVFVLHYNPAAADAEIINFYLWSETGYVSPSTGAIVPINDWYHVVGTYDGTDVKIYLNGIEKGSLVLGGLIVDYDNKLVIGNREYSASPFNGIIDEPCISDIARSGTWIKASYESERDHLLDFGSEEELVAGQPFALRKRNRYLGGFIR